MIRSKSAAKRVRRCGSVRFTGVAVAISIAGLAAVGMTYQSPSMSDATARYIADLDVARFERNGTRYTDPEMSPFRILPTLTDHDRTYHYDFAKLESVERRLAGVNRRDALRAIFDRVTSGCQTNRDRHLAVLRFLHRASFHNLIQPMYPNGYTVCDPLVLLELGEMRCGHVNRVAVDLFAAMGYRGRLEQAAFHILAEIWYDDAWHYFDGDIFGNGECAFMDDGHIPSLNELAEHVERLDALTSFWEPDHTNRIHGPTPYPSWYYFSEQAYRASNMVPSHVEKSATPEEEANSRWYGWESDQISPDHSRCLRSDVAERFAPAPPRITAVRCNDDGDCRRVSIAWNRDPAAAGYRVFVGSSSRGWNYSGASLSAETLKWKSGVGEWKPEMYEARYRLPPSDLLLLETTDAEITFELPRVESFITVMGFDAYGRSVGRRLYPVSEELRLP